MSALDKVLAAAGRSGLASRLASPVVEDPGALLVAAARSAVSELYVALAKWDPDDDGDDDSSAKGDTDHDHWGKDGKQKKPVPGKPKGNGDSKGDDDSSDSDGDIEDDPLYKKMIKSGKTPAQAAAFVKNERKKVKATGLAGAALVALAGLYGAPGNWVEDTAFDALGVRLAGGDSSDGGTSQGAGERYTDPGHQKDGKKRYPVTEGGKLSEKRIRAAWAYINQDENAENYSPENLAKIKAKIKAAAKEAGVQISDDSGSGDSKKVAATMVALAAPAAHAVPMHHGRFHGRHVHEHPVIASHDHAHFHNGDSEHNGHHMDGSGSGQQADAGW